MLGFPFGEACLLGVRGSENSWGLHRLGGNPIEMDGDASWKMGVLDFS